MRHTGLSRRSLARPPGPASRASAASGWPHLTRLRAPLQFPSSRRASMLSQEALLASRGVIWQLHSVIYFSHTIVARRLSAQRIAPLPDSRLRVCGVGCRAQGCPMHCPLCHGAIPPRLLPPLPHPTSSTDSVAHLCNVRDTTGSRSTPASPQKTYKGGGNTLSPLFL